MTQVSKEIFDKANEWLNGNYDEQTKSAVREMIANDTKELIDSFYRNLEFGTGGLRGVMGVGSNRMNIYTVGKATQGLANYLKKEFANEEIKVVICYDNRNNNTLFAQTVSSVFAANDIKVYMFDNLRPTPELSFAIRHFGCQSGVMITASHNPKEYSGYKAYWADGAQVTSPHDKSIISEVESISSIDDVKWSGKGENITIIGEEVDALFIEAVKNQSLSPDSVERHSDLKIVYTPIHGTGVSIMPQALKAFGFKSVHLVEEQCVIDGNFPTVEHPNPEDPKAMAMAVKLANEIDAEIVMASDPDADRIAVGVRGYDNEIVLLNGNQTAVLFTYYMLRRWSEKNMLTGSEYVVKTIVTSQMMRDVADSFNVECFNVLTGFKYIAEVIRDLDGKRKFICGGEESFGFMIGDFVRDKDSVSACAIFAEMAAWCKDNNSSIYALLMELYMKYGMYYDGLRNVVKKGMSGAEEIKQMMTNYRENPPQEIAGLRVVKIADYQAGELNDLLSGTTEKIDIERSNVLQYTLSDGSMVSVRPSGTEPKIKFYYGVKEELLSPDQFESTKERALNKIAAIEKSLGLN